MPLIAGESGAGFGSTSKCFRNVPPFSKIHMKVTNYEEVREPMAVI
jgi:hypothetical protein